MSVDRKLLSVIKKLMGVSITSISLVTMSSQVSFAGKTWISENGVKYDCDDNGVLRITSTSQKSINRYCVNNNWKKHFDANTVTEVRIEDNRIELLGKDAFNECLNLEKVVIEAPIKEIKGGFRDCVKLKEFYANKVTWIKEFTFENCISLNRISFPEVTVVGERAFGNCIRLEYVDMPKLETILDWSFRNCISLKELNSPKIVTIGKWAFERCLCLDNVNIPNVSSIGSYAFCHCISLQCINLPHISIIGDFAFNNCIKLLRITLGNSDSIGTTIKVGQMGFVGCRELEELNILGQVRFGDQVFTGCDKEFAKIQNGIIERKKIKKTGNLVSRIVEDKNYENLENQRENNWRVDFEMQYEDVMDELKNYHRVFEHFVKMKFKIVNGKVKLEEINK